MQPNRPRRRGFGTPDDSSATWRIDPLRASTADSGRGSMVHSGRSSTQDSNMIISSESDGQSTDRSGRLDEFRLTTETEFQFVSRVLPRSVVAATIKPMSRTSTIHPHSFYSCPILVETTNHCTKISSTRLRHSFPPCLIGSFVTSEFYSRNPMNDSTWRVGEYCVAKYSGNQLYRARILVVPRGEPTLVHPARFTLAV